MVLYTLADVSVACTSTPKLAPLIAAAVAVCSAKGKIVEKSGDALKRYCCSRGTRRCSMVALSLCAGPDNRNVIGSTETAMRTRAARRSIDLRVCAGSRLQDVIAAAVEGHTALLSDSSPTGSKYGTAAAVAELRSAGF